MPAEPKPGPAPLAGAKPNFTILVADDKGSEGGSLDDFLLAEKHRVIRARTADEALEKTRRFQPDLILLDSELNDADGQGMLLRLLRAQASAAVVMLARHPSVPASVEAMQQGAVDYLERPFDLDRLKKAIDQQKALFA